MRRFGHLIATAALCTASLGAVGNSGSAVATAEPDPCPTISEGTSANPAEESDIPEGTNVVACGIVGDIVVDDAGGPGVAIPDAGEGMIAHVDYLDEDSHPVDTQTVWVSLDGEISYELPAGSELSLEDEDIDDPLKPVVAPAACDDTYYIKYLPMNNNEPLHFDVDSYPAGTGADSNQDITAALMRSARNWTDLNTNCDVVNDVNMAVSNGGDSDNGTSVDVNANCVSTNSDSWSQISFANFNVSVGGVVCRHLRPVPGGAYVDGADMRLNKWIPWTLYGGATNCSNRYDMESIVTHEMGHIFGLNDIKAWRAHANLTMRGYAGGAFTCKTAMRSLGRGDVLGMRSLY